MKMGDVSTESMPRAVQNSTHYQECLQKWKLLCLVAAKRSLWGMLMEEFCC